MSGVALHPNRTSLGLADQQVELSPNVGDGRGQGGLSLRSDNFASVGKLAPRMIFGNWLWLLRRRQLFSATSPSLKIMASAVLLERHPLQTPCGAGSSRTNFR